MTTVDTTKSHLVRSVPGQRSGVSEVTVPGTKIRMDVVTIAPNEEAQPGHPLEAETAGFVVSGRGRLSAGCRFDAHTDVETDDFYFTPAGLPYVIRNPFEEPLVVVLAYSLDPSVVSIPKGAKIPQISDGVKVVRRPQASSATAQTRGMTRLPAISNKTVGATQIWMCYLSVSAHERGQSHHHGSTHTAAYTISGRARICFGPDFSEFIEPGPGDFAFDPPGLVHLVEHSSDDEPWRGVLARSPENIVVNLSA